MRVTFDRLQVAFDNEGPEDYEFWPKNEEECGEAAENKAALRDEE